MNISINKLIQYLEKQGPVIFLESQSRKHPWSRKSYIAAKPRATVTCRGNKIIITDKEGREVLKGDPWNALREFYEVHRDWMFGFLGYDLKNHLEKLGSANKNLVEAPDMYFMVPDLLIEIDHESGNTNFLKGAIPNHKKVETAVKNGFSDFELQRLSLQTDRETYINKIREAQRRIGEGEFYEINLSHQLKGIYEGSEFGLYNQMKKAGPVPFGSYFRMGDISICCQSPERFIRKEGTTVFSQPIKGTSPRGENYEEDQKLKQKLESSRKEMAENLMIVDLVRNDLSRIAQKGSVRVPKLFEIETFDTVHQMVSTIKAESDENDPVSVLSACFPMGSMTGAPKIRAMKAIETLEDYRRGIYSGAIGYIKPSGDFDFNVVIRTAILKKGELFYSVGGAITSDSDPEKEWDETIVKARALTETTSAINIDHFR